MLSLLLLRLFVLLALYSGGAMRPANAAPDTAPAPTPSPALVSTPDELRAALEGGAADAIHIMAPMALPLGWRATVSRTVLIMSPYRVVLDWCDAACREAALRGAAPPAAKLVLLEGAAVSWTRVFFRNFVPPRALSGAAAAGGAAGGNSSSTSGGAARRGLRAAAAGGGGAGESGSGESSGAVPLDWRSPNPFVASLGGGSTYNLVVWHFQPEMQWVFDAPGTYW